MEKYEIIHLKKQGWSNSEIQRTFGISRNTVSKYWNDYLRKQDELVTINPNADIKDVIEDLIESPQYDVSNRKPLKFTEEVEASLKEIIKKEEEKNRVLGSRHKQKLTMKQMHQMLVDQGFDISYATVKRHVNRLRDKTQEVFIKQEYSYADRFEYDFGEVKLFIKNKTVKYFIAVITAPASGFRWAYLYDNSKMSVFLDSHVRFFEMLGGCFREGVYDNMRNVVSRFIGRNEKELNPQLLKMSLYYDYVINVTNCYKGNEKGTVENAVRWIRNKVFSIRYEFDSFQQAAEYLQEKLTEINRDSSIEEEKKYLSSYRPKYEIAQISEKKVDKYSFIHVDSNIYSVPESLVGKIVTVKLYPDTLKVMYKSKKVLETDRLQGKGKTHIEISHYLHALSRKPGALRNSLALKSNPELKNIFDKYYKSKPKDFIVLLRQNPDKDIEELKKILIPDNKEQPASKNIRENTINEIMKIQNLFIGGNRYVN